MNARFTLEQAAWSAGAQVAAPGGPFEGVFTDTRQPVRGALFVALRGERLDASDFVTQAVEGGAAGVLVPVNVISKVRAQVPAGVALLTAPDTGRALGGLAERSQVVDSQLAGVPGGVRSAGQPPGDGRVERRWSATADPYSAPGVAGQCVGHERRRAARTDARRSGLGHCVAAGNGALLG